MAELGLIQRGRTLNPVLFLASLPGPGHISSLDRPSHLPAGRHLLASLIWPLHSCPACLPRPQVYFSGSLLKKTFGGSWLSRFSPAKTFRSRACLLSPSFCAQDLCLSSLQLLLAPQRCRTSPEARPGVCPLLALHFATLPLASAQGQFVASDTGQPESPGGAGPGAPAALITLSRRCVCVSLSSPPLSAECIGAGSRYLSLRCPQGPAWDVAARVHLNPVGVNHAFDS